MMKLWKSAAAVAVIMLFMAVPVQAKENMVPNYEVKFLLDSSQVVNDSGKLKKSYRSTFQTGSDYKTIGVEYLETAGYDFYNEGWTNRIRIKENGKAFELTYKKRYSIENGDIDGALTRANEEGFDISDTNYEAQVDWNYSKMTLSLSNNKEESNSGYAKLELPGKKKALKLLRDNMPGKEENWRTKSWGTDTMDDGQKCGPIYYLKYSGTIANVNVDIEIWPVAQESSNETEYITEVSFKDDTFEEAQVNRTAVMSTLENLGILQTEDSLKTKKILDAYLQ